MNPLTNMKNVLKLSENELGSNSRSSWHDQYKDSAWIFVGGLPYDLTEGDIVCVFSQYGEIVNVNLIRAKDTGKSRGFCFICYEDQRSTILAVDNLNGIKILNRTIRVDHVSEYKVPKEGKKTDEETKQLYNDGCAPKAAPPVAPVIPKREPQDLRETIADQIESDIKLPARLPIYSMKQEPVEEKSTVQEEKEEKKSKKKKKKSRHRSSSSSDLGSSDDERSKVKYERSSSDQRDKEKSKKSSKLHKKSKDKRDRSRSKEKDNNSSESAPRRNDSFAYVPKRYR